MTFQDTQTVKITAGIMNSNNTISINGITSAAFTPETAKTQIDKFLNIIGVNVKTNKMKRIRTEEAVE